MCDKLIVALTDKLYKEEITYEEFKHILKENGYDVENGTGLNADAFNADVKVLFKKEGLWNKIHNRIKLVCV